MPGPRRSAQLGASRLGKGGLERRMRAVEESFDRRARSEAECLARSVKARDEDLEERVMTVEETLERRARYEEDCASRNIKLWRGTSRGA